jgi:hypothetical protein
MYSYQDLARRSEKQYPYCLVTNHIREYFDKGKIMNFIILCACGCGTPTPQAIRTRGTRGIVKGQFFRYINGHNANLFSSEEQRRRASFRDKDALRYSGKRTNYVKLGGVHMHRVVMEKVLGRKLVKGEIVHHIDGDKWNNNPDNLQVMTQSEHIKLHLHKE